ncbi:MAG: hypothetical protein KDA36_09775, partial [Planctomycetaceae bacterium]|nr:hypothetical protein [Planctomycetaceae bacterium]
MQFLGFAVLMVLSAHELAVASLVFCVLATLNGQNWYENRFSLEYTTETKFLLLSRGGRAVTVMGLFAISLFVAVGGIRAPGGSRLGIGLSPELAGHVASYENLLGTTHGDRGFDFNPVQGDLMIWAGKKPFIDQRLELYVGEVEEDLIDLHFKTRDTFRVTKQSTIESRRKGLDTLEKYQISFAIPRLTGFNPDYQTMAGLLSDPNWAMQRLGASTAVFYRFDPKDEELVSFLKETQQIFTEEAFRKEADAIPPRVDWPTPPSVYEKYLWGRSEDLSAESLEAQHLMQLAALIPTPNPSMAYLAIRRGQQALSKNPNDVLANIVLGEAYTYLGSFDTLNSGSRGGSMIEQLRYMQAVAAYHHALISDPKQVEVHYALYKLYERARKADLAHRELQIYRNQSERFQSGNSDEVKQERSLLDQELERLQEVIQKSVEACNKQVEKVPEKQKGAARMSIYYGKGMILRAMEEMEAFPPELLSNPEVMKIRSLGLLETGRTEEAFDISGQLEGLGQQIPNLDWRGVRTICLLMIGDYDSAVHLWEEVSMEATRNGLVNVVIHLTPKFRLERRSSWPLMELEAGWNYYHSYMSQISTLKLNAALTLIEQGW